MNVQPFACQLNKGESKVSGYPSRTVRLGKPLEDREEGRRRCLASVALWLCHEDHLGVPAPPELDVKP
eukprot:scaffold47090_cov43-Prasinocladus_malaysianus.AAC.4